MSQDQHNLPKYKIAKRKKNEEIKELEKAPEETPENTNSRPLTLRQTSSYKCEDELLESSADMLQQAYGAETRARLRKERKSIFYHISGAFLLTLLCFAGTLFYAHIYKEWPTLEPINWYVPFLLSAALATWLCLQSISIWKNKSHLVATFGFALVGLTVFWNLRMLEFASNSPQVSPSYALWVPKDTTDLLITTEFNTLRGIINNDHNYAGLPIEAYHRSFYAIPHQEWRPYFERFLSNEEMDRVNTININDNMKTVASRMQQTRVDTLEALQEQLDNPKFEFVVFQNLLKPYLWLFRVLHK